MCVFLFRPITLKLLNSWTTIDAFLIYYDQHSAKVVTNYKGMKI